MKMILAVTRVGHIIMEQSWHLDWWGGGGQRGGIQGGADPCMRIMARPAPTVRGHDSQEALDALDAAALLRRTCSMPTTACTAACSQLPSLLAHPANRTGQRGVGRAPTLTSSTCVLP